MANLVLALGVLWWMLCGAVITLAIVALRGKRLYEKHELYAPYAERLGKPCWMYDRRAKGVRKFRVVAVSHKGAISVRRWDDESGHGAFWVPSGKVAERVRFKGGDAL